MNGQSSPLRVFRSSSPEASRDDQHEGLQPHRDQQSAREQLERVINQTLLQGGYPDNVVGRGFQIANG